MFFVCCKCVCTNSFFSPDPKKSYVNNLFMHLLPVSSSCPKGQGSNQSRYLLQSRKHSS